MKRTFGSVDIHKAAPIYLDCNATAPIEPAVRDAIVSWLLEEVGNAGSRTHEYGVRAKRAVQTAREQVAAVVEASTDEIVFTSGATESNNLAILGMAPHAETTGRRHIVSTAIEHKAVLEPLEALAARGFAVTLIKPNLSGVVNPDAIRAALRPDTSLVSVMHVNNETGTRQPIEEIAGALDGHAAYFHVDAAQGFGKDLDGLDRPRIDLISISSHKVYGPVGVGALVARRRGFKKPPLAPLSYGGGQERGLRPGTLPVPLIIGFGLAAELARKNAKERRERCVAIRTKAVAALQSLEIRLHGDPEYTLPHVLNFSVEGIDSEALMVALKDLVAVSNGSACTSQSYEPSHVLTAMGLPEMAIAGAVRLSWCHMTPDVDWQAIAQRVESLR
ncbi:MULTISPECIES: cysteine desulfurase DndA [Rhodomicrobium]|uniref:cysteine desulfurase DndA n=1 Tax=Rhodomicrobium TaxID=1068 RepID=UPI001FDA057E|nr:MULTISPECIES: cysteine desulfurase DndA [Rhodomicrobium]